MQYVKYRIPPKLKRLIWAKSYNITIYSIYYSGGRNINSMKLSQLGLIISQLTFYHWSVNILKNSVLSSKICFTSYNFYVDQNQILKYFITIIIHQWNIHLLIFVYSGCRCTGRHFLLHCGLLCLRFIWISISVKVTTIANRHSSWPPEIKV
jgi:hypothetical protein